MSESSQKLVDKEGVVFIIKVEHKERSSGHKIQNILEQKDLLHFLRENALDDNYCRKDKNTAIQMKFSCFPCRTVLESVTALKSHLQGGKHKASLSTTQQSPEDFVLLNGKWKQKKGIKRSLPDDLSKRQRVKLNKIQRNIEILPQHTEEKYSEAESYVEKGLRRVRPYYFDFVAHAKGRWVGRDLWSVFSTEFRAMEKSHFYRCLDAGLIKVNGEKVDKLYRVQNNDHIAHTVHRHELPVTSQSVDVIHEDESVLVVDKPPSIPVHPCGRYRHNTILFILAKELGYRDLHTVHRLDRLTSGVLIFAKSAQRARDLEALMSGRHVQKEYICRVHGEFPEGEVVCDQPIEVISYKIGVCIVSDQGKVSKTVFKRIAYKDGVSVVACTPKTGRMHQIRVHLQYLGFPISNDPLYNSDVFGPNKGEGGVNKSRDQLIKDLITKHTVDNWIRTDEYEQSKLNKIDDTNTLSSDNIEAGDSTDKNPALVATCDDNLGSNECNDDQIENKVSNLNDEPKYISQNGVTTQSDKSPISSVEEIDNGDKEETAELKANETTLSPEKGQVASDSNVDEYCLDCKTKFKDPPEDTLLIYLHAYKYSGPGWSYTTKLPNWTQL